MKAVIYAMGKETGAPLSGGTAVENRAGLDLFQLRDDLLLCVSGYGKVNAALAAQHLIDCHGVTEVWNAGVTGCFRDDPPGTLIAAASCVQHDMDVFGDPAGETPTLKLVHLPCDGAEDMAAALAAAGYPCRTGVVATGDWFQRDFDRAARIRDSFGADVCDMEAAAIAQVCLRSAIPFRCLKVVSDHLFHPAQYEEYQANLPAAVARLNGALATLLRSN